MANVLFDNWVEALQQGSSNTSLTGNVKALLIDEDLIGKAVTGATNATPIVVTATAHGLSNGMLVSISGVAGNTAANGIFKVANVTTNTFELQHRDTGANIAGSGAYTSGGRVMLIGLWTFISDVSAGIVARSANLASKTFGTVGPCVFDAADTSFTAVAAGSPCEALMLAIDTGTDSTSRLVVMLDSGVTGLPVTPNGTDITVTWAAGGIFRQ